MDSFEYISEISKAIILKNKPIFVLGDFNDDLFHEDSKLNKIIKNVNLHQLLNKPTRITPTSSSLHDVIITNKPDMIMSLDVSPCEIADYELTSVDINIIKPKRSPVLKTFRCLTNYSPEALHDLLLAEVPTLNTILKSDDINFQVNTFTGVFQSCQDSCAPMVTREITRPPAPWITADLKESIKNKNEVQKEFKSDRNNIALESQYRNIKKKVRADIKNSSNNYFKKPISKL